VIRNVVALRAEGRAQVEAVVYRTAGTAEQRLPADMLFLHQGVVPNVNLAMAAGIEHRWDALQLCWTPVLDPSGNSAIPGIAIAGDGAGIAGAEAAQARGELAGLAAVKALRPAALGRVLRDETAVCAGLQRAMRGRAFLEAYYQPASQFRRPTGDTIACRCEEVTARQIIDTVALGCIGPNQMKSFLRCGMGPCQGRLCGLTVTELIAQARGVPPQAVGHYRLRPPVKPVTLGELAGLPTNEAAQRSVART
jgi:bacterioferritin-associated ferredoxin